MGRRGLVRGWLSGSGALLLSVGAGSAHGQFPAASGPPIVLGAPVAAEIPPPATTTTAPRTIRLAPVPGSGGLGAEYATPPFSEARKRARVANRYTVSRPVYAGRPGNTFAGYSDYYFPRVIGAKETVFTAPAGGSVPVGEAAFRTPAPAGTEVLPRIFRKR